MNTSNKRKEKDDMLSPMPPPPPQKRRLFQVNRHVQASIMLLSVMDGAELDLNNSLLPSASKTATTTVAANTSSITPSSLSTSDDYEKGERHVHSYASDTFRLDLHLAAELGRCLLERNQELQTYIGVLQKQIDDEQCDIKVNLLPFRTADSHACRSEFLASACQTRVDTRATRVEMQANRTVGRDELRSGTRTRSATSQQRARRSTHQRVSVPRFSNRHIGAADVVTV